MRRIRCRGLSSGTVPERNAPESLTPAGSCYVHRNISRRGLSRSTRSSLAPADKGRFGGEFLKGCENAESNQKSGRVKPIPLDRRCGAPTPALPRKREREKTAAPDDRHLFLVLAARRSRPLLRSIAPLSRLRGRVGVGAAAGDDFAIGTAAFVIPGRCQRVRPMAGPMTGSASNYDAQLHIGESRDSPMRNCASEVWCLRTIPE
jgi:hypothetical protein